MREQCQRVLHHAARCPRLVLTAAGIADIVGKKIAERIGRGCVNTAANECALQLRYADGFGTNRTDSDVGLLHKALCAP